MVTGHLYTKSLTQFPQLVNQQGMILTIFYFWTFKKRIITTKKIQAEKFILQTI